jgi:hypothetical protein
LFSDNNFLSTLKASVSLITGSVGVDEHPDKNTRVDKTTNIV